jgi:hypothetical protein
MDVPSADDRNVIAPFAGALRSDKEPPHSGGGGGGGRVAHGGVPETLAHGRASADDSNVVAPYRRNEKGPDCSGPLDWVIGYTDNRSPAEFRTQRAKPRQRAAEKNERGAAIGNIGAAGRMPDEGGVDVR